MVQKAIIEVAPNPFRSARRAGVPIVAIESADPAATIVKCTQALNGSGDMVPALRWDLIRGLTAINQPGACVLSHFGDKLPLSEPSTCLAELVSVATGPGAESKLKVIPESELEKPEDKRKSYGAIVYMIHANRWLDDTGSMQAVWNVRDAFEPLGCTLVLIGPSIKLPVELKNDVVLISEPLPAHAELSTILDAISSEADLKDAQIGDREIVIDTMSGTSAFGARQILSMSITKDGIDTDQLWERKRKMIEQTPGLKVWRGDETLDDLGGMDNLKKRLKALLTSGVSPVRLIVFQDEIEKALQGATGGALDGGTSADQLKVVLQFMADYKMPGIILVGPGGTGKSAAGKAAGKIARCPVVDWDFGAMKDGLVGSSENRIRGAVDILKAVSDCKCFFIATCNKIESLPSELRRRYKQGIFYCDLPTREAAKKIWKIWIKKFGLSADQPLPESEGWTGAEIAACCEGAWRTNETLIESAQYIVPVIKSAPASIEALRKLADNAFINAEKPGLYRYNPAIVQTTQPTGRKIEV